MRTVGLVRVHLLLSTALAAPVDASASAARSLDLAQRIELAARVEQVYASRRAAAGSPGAKVMPVDREAMADRVAMGLRAGAALGRRFGRPLSAEQVQREMERMVRDSQRPDILREIWTALDDDPTAFAEVVARPALAERLARTWYGGDRGIHAPTRERATAALARTGGARDLEHVAADRVELADLTLASDRSTLVDASEVTPNALSAVAESLGVGADTTWAAAIGKRSSLLEDDRSFYAWGLLRVDGQQAKVVRATWDKVPFEAWVADVPLAAADLESMVDGEFHRPRDATGLAAASCAGEGWSPISYMPEGRGGVAWVWTGTELVIWGGLDVILLNFGDRYDPATDRWTPMTTRNAPSPREGAFAAWTGSEVVVWGGRGQSFVPLGSGGRYNPISDTWQPMSELDAPVARSGHRMVYTGSEVVVWGGFGVGGSLQTGGNYDPIADTWTPTSLGAGVPEARGSGFAMVWTGSEVVVWGGCGLSSPCEIQTGGRYNPRTDTWSPTSLLQAPSPRRGHAFTWTGTELFVWGGCQPGPSPTFCDLNPRLANGGLYNPATDTWRATTDIGAPHGRAGHWAVWSGSEVIVWGGCYVRRDTVPDCPDMSERGRRYDPIGDRWIAMNTDTPGLDVDLDALAVWTGSEMILWRGSSRALSFGKRYSPATDSWVDMPPGERPSPRRFHSAIWTGVEMILWGGVFSNGFPYWGGSSYDLALDQWTTLTPATWDESRQRHSAVWTGTEMIFWGGSSAAGLSANSGARYDPSTRIWTPVSATDAPLNRIDAVGLWTGGEMIVWGSSWDAGRLYDPLTDTWRAMSMVDSPPGQLEARGVWTGDRMLVWGGWDGTRMVASGGSYDPSTDRWSALNSSGAPSPRSGHQMTWTGSEMVVFGGYDDLFQPLAQGGSYELATDTWRPLSVSGEPSARWAHGVAWNGSEVVVWGGCETFGCNDFGQNPLADAAWDPISDRWRPLDIRLAPEPRGWHSTVRAGDQILVWGGEAGNYSVPTGGIYCGAESLVSPGEAGQLRLVKAPGSDEILASWSASCAASADDYIIYEGKLGDWGTWAPATCSTGGGLSARLSGPLDATYFVVVPRTSDLEGGASRPASVTACLPRYAESTCR